MNTIRKKLKTIAMATMMALPPHGALIADITDLLPTIAALTGTTPPACAG